jgi:putative membrane protein
VNGAIENIQESKKWLYAIYAVSLIVLAAVVILYNLPPQESIPAFVPFLPKMNALINGTCSLLLIISFFSIRNKKVQLHKRLNIITFALSSLFLVSYVIFHSFGIETRFPVDNPLRPLYLVILLSHIILAAIVLPLVLISFYYGLGGNVIRHRKIARWAFPVWLYVTFTGVIVYLMISPYYAF